MKCYEIKHKKWNAIKESYTLNIYYMKNEERDFFFSSLLRFAPHSTRNRAFFQSQEESSTHVEAMSVEY